MIYKFVIETFVKEDGKLVIQLPPDMPRGRVRVTLEGIEAIRPVQPEHKQNPTNSASGSDSIESVI